MRILIQISVVFTRIREEIEMSMKERESTLNFSINDRILLFFDRWLVRRNTKHWMPLKRSLRSLYRVHIVLIQLHLLKEKFHWRFDRKKKNLHLGINEADDERIFVHDSLEVLISGGMVDCLTIGGDLGFGGGYWWAVEDTGFGCCTTELGLGLDDMIIPSRLLNDLFVECNETFEGGGGVGVDIGGLFIVGGGTTIDSIGLLTDDGCVLINWLRAGTSSSMMFDGGRWDSDTDDIWRCSKIFIGTDGSELFTDNLLVDFESSST